MIKKIIKKYKEYRKNKRDYINKLIILENKLKEAQDYVDHEGKMRSYCEWNKRDYDFFYKLCEKRDIARKNLSNHIENGY